MSDGRFAYRAVAPGGELRSATIDAPDRAAALRRLNGAGMLVVDIDSRPSPVRGSPRTSDRSSEIERRLALKQLSVMLAARVELLEAVEAVGAGLPAGATHDGLLATAVRLRSGDRFADALTSTIPDYPRYVGALVAAGEATGRLPQVLREASDQLSAEAAARREFRSALVYPALLVGAGLLVVLFLFYVIVPRFAQMLGRQREQLTGLADLVLSTGEAVRALGPFAALIVLVPLLLGRAALSNHAIRRSGARLFASLPIAGPMIERAWRMRWTRIMGLALGAGVGVVEALRLAIDCLPDARLRDALDRSLSAIRKGTPLAEAMDAPGVLTAMDLSLVRVGQRTGSLADMFGVIASYHQDELLAALKRSTVLVEQLAIAIVATAIGVIVISLVTAMTSVYGAIQ